MTETKKYLSFFDKNVDLSAFVIAAMFLMTIATGLVNQTFLSFGIVLCCIMLLLLDRLCLAFPFVLFYYSYYGLLFGVSVFRIFTILLLLNMFFKYEKKYSIKKQYLPVIFVYAIYLVVVMMPQGIDTAVYIFLDIVCCFALVSEIVDNEKLTKDCFKVYTGVCFLSYFTGIVSENTIGGEYGYTRFNATFEDPNYMGFFFTVAVFSVIALKLFDKRVRYFIVIALYAMMMASLSMTAILVNILLWLFYCVLTKKIKIKFIVLGIVIVAVLIGLYNFGLDNPDIGVLGELSSRIEEKILDLTKGEIADFTSGRTNRFEEHAEYYFNSSISTILFGGVAANTRYIDPELGGAAHNEYIDMLLNIGIVGAFIMFRFFFLNYLDYYKKFKELKQQQALFFVMVKTAWLCYAITLTVFLDFRFMIFFII